MSLTTKQRVSQFFLWLLSILGAAMLFGRDHVFLGSMLGMLQFPLICLGTILIWKRRKLGFRLAHLVFTFVAGVMLVHAIYERTWRLRWVNVGDNPQEISVLSYNLFFKNNYKQNIINEIKENPTDILVVQELTPLWKVKLSPILNSRYPYKKDLASKYTHGTGVYSKYPILSSKIIRNTSSQPFCQIVELKIGGKKVVVVNIHLASPAVAVENPDRFFPLYLKNAEDRKSQMDKLHDFLEERHKGKPVIMLGDLNTPRLEPLYRKLRYKWADLHKKTGWGMGWTFPNIAKLPFPMVTLDYIFYRGKIKGKAFKVLPNSSSDHLAVWGLLEV